MPQNTIIVTGAGVDKTPGIDFPLAADLLPAINSYLTRTDDGKAVDTLIRSKIPGLRFKFDRFINSAITDIGQREPEQLRQTIERVQRAVDMLSDDGENRIARKQGELIIRLFNQLQQIATANLIDDHTRELIEEVFGENSSQFDLDDHVVDIRTLSVSETFKSILRFTLRQSLDSQSNQIAHALGADLLDIEKLLIEKFLGFYNNRMADIKNYVYISWCFWAFLVYRDKQVQQAHRDLPFYSSLPEGWKAVTLNYTSFLVSHLGDANVIHFHGGLTKYVRMDNRQLLSFDHFEGHTAAELLASHICDNWFFNEDDPAKSRCLIPSLVPPLRLKPILSKEYIDLWYAASKWLSEADSVLVVGYSLNTADEHFNDLLRSLRGTRITVIAPDALRDDYLSRVTSVWGVSADQLTNARIQSKDAKRCGDLTLISACAHEVNIDEL